MRPRESVGPYKGLRKSKRCLLRRFTENLTQLLHSIVNLPILFADVGKQLFNQLITYRVTKVSAPGATGRRGSLFIGTSEPLPLDRTVLHSATLSSA